jgi:hypothetical protein
MTIIRSLNPNRRISENDCHKSDSYFSPSRLIETKSKPRLQFTDYALESVIAGAFHGNLIVRFMFSGARDGDHFSRAPHLRVPWKHALS